MSQLIIHPQHHYIYICPGKNKQEFQLTGLRESRGNHKPDGIICLRFICEEEPESFWFSPKLRTELKTDGRERGADKTNTDGS